MLQWLALAMAVAAEVSGTTMMKWIGQNESLTGYAFLFALIGLSYFFLSKAIVKIPLSTAYATWEGVGLVAITIIGCLLFKESLSAAKLLGITTILLGIFLLKNGTTHKNTGGGTNE